MEGLLALILINVAISNIGLILVLFKLNFICDILKKQL